MFIKLIKIGTTRDRRHAFLSRQRLWNEAMSGCDGFIDAVVAHNSENNCEIYIIAIWRDRESLESFMRDVHDDIQASSEIKATYDEISVSHLKVDDSLLPSGAGHLLFGSGVAGIVSLSEAYRASAILRTAVLCGLFEAVGLESPPLDTLAARLRFPEPYVRRLASGLAALGLVTLRGRRITLSEHSRRHLRREEPGYIGDLVLHNTRPALWERWGSLHRQLGTPDTTDVQTDHARFVNAMSGIASAGQARELVDRVDLSGRKRLLDVGGACGDYAIALLREWPHLQADIFDLRETEPYAKDKIRQARATRRVHFVAGDYRHALPNKGYDVALLSNVLRGESRNSAMKLLSRIRSCLAREGLIIIQDLFPDTTAGYSGMLAAFFGLHLPDALNPTSDDVAAMLAEAGYSKIRIELLESPIVANKLIIATT